MHVGRDRDLRLDIFRGFAMLIIFVAHVPGNSWAAYIPARFGFSSAAEMFVFCSGFASALAFGSVFERRGWRMGTVRILFRIWQLYWAHVGLFLVLATISIVAVRLSIGTRDYPADLSFSALADHRFDGIVGLMTLSLVPDLLNILPMYVVLLALTPLAMALSKVSPLLVIVASAALWTLVQATGLNLPAGGAVGRTWFFDPFAWQLMFFTGFAFAMRWLPRPRLNHPALLPIATAAVILSVPVNFWGFTDAAPALRSTRDWLIANGVVATTRLDILRYAHFLCLAYVALSLVERFPKAIASPALAPVILIGRQSLPAFLSSVVLAWTAGILLDHVGRDSLPVAAVNLIGFMAIFAVARSAAWLKSAPWAGGSERVVSRRTTDAAIGAVRGVAVVAPVEPIRRRSSPMPSCAHPQSTRGQGSASIAPSGRRRLAAVLSAGWLLLGAVGLAHPCGTDAPCLVASGAYLARPPSGWDGRSSLPTVMFFHGWMQSAADVMRNETMARVMSDLGVLLVAPDGAGHTWSFPGGPGHYRDEFAFVRAVLDDVEVRFPIDKHRLWASGFSQGASMVWYAACFFGDRFVAFVPIAGDFWEPPPKDCPSGPVSIRHIHGLSDETFPAVGRAVTQTAHQGNLWRGWALWLRTDGCSEPPDRVETVGQMTCETWVANNCSTGRELMLCLHDRGHMFDPEWLRDAYHWVTALDLTEVAPPSEAATPNRRGP